jgi:hypothetical protein
VCVFVSVLNVFLMDMWVLVSLSVMAVLMLVLDVVMIMQGVRVRMRHILVRMLMSMLCCGHRLLRPRSYPFGTPGTIRMDGTLINPMLHAEHGLSASFSVTQINAPNLQLARRCKYIFILPSNGRSRGLRRTASTRSPPQRRALRCFKWVTQREVM